MIDIGRIQAALAKEKLDAWLLYDFRGVNLIARDLLRVPGQAILTRRWFYCIPREGEPVALQHPLEPESVAHLPGRKIVYGDRYVLLKELKETVSGFKTVAMEYSPTAALPTVSRVDAGTVELVQSLGPRVVSSAGLIQEFLAVLTSEEIDSHRRAAEKVLAIKEEAFGHVLAQVRSNRPTTEHEIQQFIMQRFEAEGLVTDHPPIVAVNAHAGLGHYEPSADKPTPVRQGDLLLIDLWASEPGGVFADITWTAYLGDRVPDRIARVFEIVARARDAAVERIAAGYKEHRAVTGADADRAARRVIADAGYGEKFTHRTGHSITSTLHGPGANLDDFETEDVRPLVPGLLFSVEPGIYLEDFGIRSEINVLVAPFGPEITTLPLQTEVRPLLKT